MCSHTASGTRYRSDMPRAARARASPGLWSGGGGRARRVRADVEPWRIERTCTVHRIGLRGARSRRDQDGRELADAIRFAPARHIRQRVTAEDQEQLAFRAERVERVDRVRGAVTVELDPRKPEAWLV